MIQDDQSSPYHPQQNGTIKMINKILERTLAKIVSVRQLNWEEKSLVVLWAYKITYKRLNKKTPFKLIYVLEEMVPVEFQFPSLIIIVVIEIDENRSL